MVIVKLFDLLTADCQIIIDGNIIDSVDDYATDASGNLIMRCEDGGDQDWYFADQDVEFANGSCKAILSNVESEDDSEAVSLSFWKRVPLDFEDIK